MAGTRVYASMLPCIKCSECGAEVEISMMGDHKCVSAPATTQKDQNDHATPSISSLKPPRRPSSPQLHSVRKPSPLATPPLRPDSPEDDERPEPVKAVTTDAIPQMTAPSPPNLRSHKSTTSLRTNHTRIDPENTNDLQVAPSPLMSNAADISTISSPSFAQNEPMPPLPIPSRTAAPVRPPRPPSIELIASQNNPFSSIPAESNQTLPETHLGPSTPGSPESQSPPRQRREPLAVPPLLSEPKSNPLPQRPTFSSKHSSDEQDSAFLRKLSIPETSRPVEETMSAQPVMSHSHKPSFPGSLALAETNKGGPEASQLSRSRSRAKSFRKSSSEKVGLGLFRRKSSKSFSKKDISSPDLRTFEHVPALPSLPFSATQGVSAISNAKLDRDGRLLPSGPAPPRPARPDTEDAVISDLQRSHSSQSRRAEIPEKHITSNVEHTHDAKSEPPSNRQSDASIYTLPSGQEPADKGSQGNVGLPGISEVSGRTTGSANEKRPPISVWPHRGVKNGLRPQQDHPHPPLLTLATSPEVMNGRVDHSSAESVSSNGSRLGFDDRTDSSVSSPPTSTASSFSHTKQQLHEDPVTHVNAISTESNQRPSSTFRQTANFSRPRIVESPSMTLKNNQSEPTLPNLGPSCEPPHHTPPSEPTASMAPHQSHTANLLPDPDQAPVIEASPPLPFEEPPRPRPNPYRQKFDRPPMPPMPEEPPPMPHGGRPPLTRRRTTATARGHCRGCAGPITGKSVKAADGRLTGRYHRECFVCRTCKAPFPTMDFYVMMDEPYCALHYHTLNNSLCQSCNCGIEGPYTEITPRRRFHAHCFSCHQCRRPLTRDYFEINGLFFCELDAKREHQRGQHLTPNRRFPERRTTKMMMMELA